jgi:predicted phosphodiesterase
MKTAILSDIHGNMEALEAVLKDIDKNGGVDRFWCLGDTVDYGPQPHQCLEKVRQLKALNIIGNHDAAVCGKVDFRKVFAGDFVQVTTWTESHLPDEDKEYLSRLPVRIEVEGFTLVHGSPREPFWEYMLDQQRANENVPFMNTHYCLVGHTHVNACFEVKEQDIPQEMIPFSREMDKKYFKDGKFNFEFKAADNNLIELSQERLIINPGSVGQQRSKDPRAAYAIHNTENATIELRRVEYDKVATLNKMKEVGLPDWLTNKLAAGT